MSRYPLRPSGILALLAGCAMFATAAQAFYPFGGFSELNQRNVFVHWAFEIFDADESGDVTGPNDGVEITMETGIFGFTTKERQTVVDAFDVWTLPTSYVKFRFAESTSDPLETIPDIGDLVNYVCLAVPEEPSGQFEVVGDGILGITLPFVLLDDGPIGTDDFTVIANGGEFIDVDLVINGEAHRSGPDDLPPIFDLLSTTVHEIGHMLGLGHSPLNNFIETIAQGDEFDVEEKVLAIRDKNGDLVIRGATPTMYPFAFFERTFGILVKTDDPTVLDPKSLSMQRFASKMVPPVTRAPLPKSAMTPPADLANEVVFYFPDSGELKTVDRDNPPSWAKQRPRAEKGVGPRRINFTVTYEDVENNTGIGFDNPEEGADRRACVERVLDYLDTILNETGSCDIVFLESLTDTETGVLASAAPALFFEDPIPPIPVGYFSPSSVSNITRDIDPLPGIADIAVQFNFAFRWNTTDDRPVSNEFDMFSTLIHEITHGLGFLSLSDSEGESLVGDNIYALWDSFLENGFGDDLWEDLTPVFIGTPEDLLGQNGGVVFAGPAAVAAFGGVEPPVFAPNEFLQGSSLSHWDQGVLCRAVMEPATLPTEMRRNYSPIDVGALVDLGYLNASEPAGFVFNCDGTVKLKDGGVDLAPEDFVATSWLYPRGDQDTFFALKQESRTTTRSDIPSIPILGGIVTAWIDHDKDDTTQRVPIFSTMTGLYENSQALFGRFDMKQLLKQFETPEALLFNADYVLTHHPLNGLDATGQPPEAFDSMHGAIFPDTGERAYFPSFISEVFRSDGNANFNSKADVARGTPVVYDEVRRQIIVLDGTDRPLAQVLPGTKPMFGDQDQTCPLTVTINAGLISTRIPNHLRTFRDSVLMESAVGAALTDAYYQIAPSLAGVVARHLYAQYALAAVIHGVEWCIDHTYEVIFMIALAVFAWRKFRQRRRTNRWMKKAVSAATLIAALTLAHVADAKMYYISTPDMVAKANEVMTGKIVSLESYWSDTKPRMIFTAVTVEVGEKVKGTANKGATVIVKIPGGRVGDVASPASETPTFKKGDEVLVFLQASSTGGYKMLSGSRGKFEIKTDANTGEKRVMASTPEAKAGLIDSSALLSDGDQNSAKKKAEAAGEKGVSLDKYLKYLKGIAVDQEKKKDQSAK